MAPPRGSKLKSTRRTKNPSKANASDVKSEHRQGDSQAQPSVSGTEREIQQKCLNIFRDAFGPSVEDTKLLQEVKGHLYARDFSAAFGREDYLRVYASRWSPSRALGYLHILDDVASKLQYTPSDEDGQTERDDFHIVCVGGGAGGELVALAGWLRSQLNARSSSTPKRARMHLVDVADWAQLVETLQQGITTAPELSKYASQARKDANTPLIHPSQLSVDFHRCDVLDVAKGTLLKLVPGANLVTFMFTLNELYSTSVQKTQHLLRDTLSSMQPGSQVLIVDSSGSYSTVSVNGTEKKYPMQWLLEHAFQGLDEEQSGWKRLVSDDSRWFRMPEGLEYPIELENMRYQIHLYQRRSEAG